MLSAAHEIVVLGYSFCDEDSHIASLVRTALWNNPAIQLSYYSYHKNLSQLSNDSQVDYASGESKRVLKKLRLPENFNRIKVFLVEDYNSKAINELVR